MMRDNSPSGGWRLVQQVMHRCRPPAGQERRVLRRLHESGSQSLKSLRKTVNTREESLYTTLSRLEDKGFAVVRDSQHIEITQSGVEAWEVVR